MTTASSEMPFDITEQAVGRGTGARHVMVITPRRSTIVGRKRLDDLRKPSGISRVERWLIEQARERGASARILLFRAVNNEGERVWQFDPSLSEPDLEDGGLVMSKALLPFHRRLMASGVVLMVHTDWGLRECYAMRSGVHKALDELARPHDADPTREADRWVLSHMLLHAALDLSHIVDTLLPAHLTMVERRWPRVRELVARLPADAID
jgi:hypothetical protein